MLRFVRDLFEVRQDEALVGQEAEEMSRSARTFLGPTSARIGSRKPTLARFQLQKLRFAEKACAAHTVSKDLVPFSARAFHSSEGLSTSS